MVHARTKCQIFVLIIAIHGGTVNTRNQLIAATTYASGTRLVTRNINRRNDRSTSTQRGVRGGNRRRNGRHTTGQGTSRNNKKTVRYLRRTFPPQIAHPVGTRPAGMDERTRMSAIHSLRAERGHNSDTRQRTNGERSAPTT